MALMLASAFSLTTGGCAQASDASAQQADGDAMVVEATESTRANARRVVKLAEAFMLSLTPEQRASVIVDDSFAHMANWSNLPEFAKSPHRVGLATNTLSQAQWAALGDLLRASTGTAPNAGFDKIEQILNGDDFIHLHGRRNRSGYGRPNYHVAFVGRPSLTGRWALQFGGHHIALINTYRGGTIVGVTPSFRGVDPIHPFEQNGRRNDPLGEEYRAAKALLGSFTSEQSRVARFARRPGDVVLGPGDDWMFKAKSTGIPVSNLSEQQRKLLVGLIRTYTDDTSADVASTLLKRYTDELDQTTVSFAGDPALTTSNDYVRIEGPSLWIELLMDAPYSFPNPHVHTVWRDKRSDYGGRRH